MSIRYTKEHEWIKLLPDGAALVGISDHAQEALGDITFVEFPRVGEEFDKGAVFGVVESVKAASDLYMPVSGKVLETNAEVDKDPQLVNTDPTGHGWLMKIQPRDPSEAASLMPEKEYLASL